MRACLAVRIFIIGVVAGAARGKSMSATGLEVFDKTVQTTNAWLKEIMEANGLDRRRAYRVLAAVLHALRDRLTVDEVAQLGAQLPILVRGLYYDQWHSLCRKTRSAAPQGGISRGRCSRFG